MREMRYVRPEVRDRFVRIWTDPFSLDPAWRSARVTREIAERLAAVSKALEGASYPPEEAAMFLMRCLFTMFAEDVGLLPAASFRHVLEQCEQNPSRFQPKVGQLWEAMDGGGYAFAVDARVKRFNGEFFKSRAALPLAREEIGELRRAAACDWKEADPSIFGTLLEQALDPAERRRLGAHYTPRAYVERLVVATIIEPLREDWSCVTATAERQKSEGRLKDAAATVRTFHDKLCATRVLDPACGTGNFLYVSLELLKRLEGEVLEALADLGGQEALSGLAGHTVDPHQFLGLEKNTRAAAIAELVLWIGYLQWHICTKGGLPSEPILKAFRNIQGGVDAILTAKETLARDDFGKPILRPDANGKLREIYIYDNPRHPEWPAAEFIVGNPPFVAGQDFRKEFGDGYAEALWQINPHMPGGADLVMYWWDHAAELLTRPGTPLRRFGFVTTNSITQEFSHRVVARRLKGKDPISLTMAIPNHPWTRAMKGHAAVRIAMTVAERGRKDGILREVVAEEALDTDEPRIAFRETFGRINPNLTVGIDVTSAVRLRANEGICHDGVKLHGKGFVVKPADAEFLGLRRRPGLDQVIRPYRNGRDINQHPRDVLVIDLCGFAEYEVRQRFPEVYQHLLESVKPARERECKRSGSKDAKEYAKYWWLFGKPREQMRPALVSLSRYIATVDTARHRIFQFLPIDTVCDDKVVIIASDDAYHLGVLSSRAHIAWCLAQRTRLGQGDDPVYGKSRCFAPFPFPEANDRQRMTIGAIAEEIDARRKRAQSEHPDLTLTGLYNVLAKLRGGVPPAALSPEDRRIHDEGLVLTLGELHRRLDEAVANSYGWPPDLQNDEVVGKLLARNRERAAEEASGLIRWLRPDFQIPRFGKPEERAEFELAGAAPGQDLQPITEAKALFPTDEVAQTAAVMAMLASATAPMDAASIAAHFRQGNRMRTRIAATLSALARTGYVTTPDQGRSFLLRRAA